jgi:hypothetical protein
LCQFGGSAIAFGRELAGQALHQVVNLPLSVLGKLLVEGDKLLKGNVRVVFRVVVHTFQWTRSHVVAQANRKVAAAPERIEEDSAGWLRLTSSRQAMNPPLGDYATSGWAAALNATPMNTAKNPSNDSLDIHHNP